VLGSQENITRLMQPLKTDGYLRDQEVDVNQQNGEKRTGLVSANVIMLKDTPHFVMIIRDIEELRRTEQERRDLTEQLVQSQKLESIGRLAGGVAHDFNNLLTVILSTSQMMLLRTEKDDPLRREWGVVESAAIKASNLTRQLLAFSRKQVLAPKVINLNEALKGMDRMLRRVIGEDIVLSTLLGDELWPVKADPGQMEQVIVNLAVNARDAMPKGGHLTFETRNVSLSKKNDTTVVGVKDGDYVLLTVRDTGMGMSQEVLDRVFEPFFTTKREGEGTGLGLATVYGIVKQSDGEIRVESGVNKGTTFRIYMPRTDEVGSDEEKESWDPSQFSGKEKILIVEDNTDVRQTTSKVLRHYGYDVHEVGSGVEALEMIDQNKLMPDLIITDVVMPNMNGVELVKEVRSRNKRMKILFISGYTDHILSSTESISECCVEFLEKPLDPRTLVRKVRSLLDESCDCVDP
jgi:signal transduction histidine kinase/ActR/RegA family two-component response regulator